MSRVPARSLDMTSPHASAPRPDLVATAARAFFAAARRHPALAGAARAPGTALPYDTPADMAGTGPRARPAPDASHGMFVQALLRPLTRDARWPTDPDVSPHVQDALRGDGFVVLCGSAVPAAQTPRTDRQTEHADRALPVLVLPKSMPAALRRAACTLLYAMHHTGWPARDPACKQTCPDGPCRDAWHLMHETTDALVTPGPEGTETPDVPGYDMMTPDPGRVPGADDRPRPGFRQRTTSRYPRKIPGRSGRQPTVTMIGPEGEGRQSGHARLRQAVETRMARELVTDLTGERNPAV